MSLLLENTQAGVAVAHRHIDDAQPDAYYEPGDEHSFHFDRAEWEQRYWNSGDPGPLTRAWKERNAPDFYRGLDSVDAVIVFMRSRRIRLNMPVGFLHLAKIHGATGDVQDFGLVSAAVVTDVGCQKLVAIMNTTDAVTAANFKFHALGTGTVAESAADTGMGTELTTEYNPDNTRATGSQTTGATTKVYRTVGTNTLDSGTPAVTEHGPMAAATGASSLLDRSKFAAINLTGANGDGIQATYDFTTTSGG